jgi:hypothetical protein
VLVAFSDEVELAIERLITEVFEENVGVSSEPFSVGELFRDIRFSNPRLLGSEEEKISWFQSSFSNTTVLRDIYDENG